jgi:uncharacterized membrane protein YhhN
VIAEEDARLLLSGCALTLVAMVGFLVAEWRESAIGKWIAKPLASAGFVGAALAAGALESAYGRWVLGALAFSWLGDVLLIPHSTFIFGLASFLVGHLLFAGAFIARGVDPTFALIAGAVSLIPLVVVARWLLPHVEKKMRAPVVAYMIAISVMVSLAVGSFVNRPSSVSALTGAIAFYLSDLSVARDRFVAPGFVNRLWGVPLYYIAQLLFALSVIGSRPYYL